MWFVNGIIPVLSLAALGPLGRVAVADETWSALGPDEALLVNAVIPYCDDLIVVGSGQSMWIIGQGSRRRISPA